MDTKEFSLLCLARECAAMITRTQRKHKPAHMSQQGGNIKKHTKNTRIYNRDPGKGRCSPYPIFLRGAQVGRWIALLTWTRGKKPHLPRTSH